MHLRSERTVTPAGVLDGVVSIDGAVISDVAPAVRAGVPALDLRARWLLPGFIDVHVHGGGGAQCNTTASEEIRTVARFHATHGTTALLATTVAASPSALESALEAIAARWRRARTAAAVLGSHLEGPFRSPRRPGAMDPTLFLEPDAAVARRLLGAGRGTVRMVTLAPELPGGVELIRFLAGEGVVVSIGHSDASYGRGDRGRAVGDACVQRDASSGSP
jgi:N-acetylglucosamine-6-phosphate deacetylase